MGTLARGGRFSLAWHYLPDFPAYRFSSNKGYPSPEHKTSLAEIGQFPPLFGPRSRLGKHGGLLVTGALSLILANFVDLSAIASVGSACSLVVFLLSDQSSYISGVEHTVDGGSTVW